MNAAIRGAPQGATQNKAVVVNHRCAGHLIA